MSVDVKTSLPEMDWQIGDTITVTCDDPSAVITQLIIRVNQQAPPGKAPEPDALLAHLPTNA